MSIKDDYKKPLNTLKESMVRRGLLRTRCEKAFDNIGKSIGGVLPALSKARVSAYKGLGLPSPNLMDGLRVGVKAPTYTTSKDGWRALLDGIPIVVDAKRPDGATLNVPPDRTENGKAIYEKANAEWEISENGNITVKVNKQATGIRDLKLADALDVATKDKLPIPNKVRKVAINAYGVAPLLAPMKINPDGMVEPNWEIGYSGQPMSIPALLKEFAGNDMLADMGAVNIPENSTPIPKGYVWRSATLVGKRDSKDSLFSHSDDEITSAMMVLHPEYETRLVQDKVWLVNAKTNMGLPTEGLSRSWNQGKFRMDRYGSLVPPQVRVEPEAPAVDVER